MKLWVFLICITILFWNSSLGQALISVDNYLSLGSDTKAIKMALDDARKHGGQVKIEFGNRTYIIDPTELMSNNSVSEILYPVTGNLTISGAENTVLKLKTSWPQKHNFNISNFILFGSKQSVSNFKIQGVTINFDGSYNYLKVKNGKYSNAFLYLLKGRNITVSDIRVLNNPGRQSICIGGKGVGGKYLVSNVVIDGCSFLTVVDNLKDNSQDDHSSVYLAADSAYVTNNMFNSGPRTSNVATAIEVHTINSTISNNSILNYSTGVNIVAIDGDQLNSDFLDNSFANVKKAFVFWGAEGRRISDIRIIRNKVSQSPVNFPIIRMARTLNTYIDSLEIADNYFNTLISKPSVFGHAIEIGYVKRVFIKNNIFENINGRAITLVGTNLNIELIEILDNVFKNINLTGNANYKNIIELKAIGKIQSLIIQNNRSDRTNNFVEVGRQIQIGRSIIRK